MHFTSIMFAACTAKTKQQTAEKLATDYLKTKLNDPSSYESVSFDTLKTSWKLYTYHDKEGIRLEKQSEMYANSIEEYQYKDSTLSSKFSKLKDSVNQIIYKNEKGYKNTVDFYYLSHVYRAKNQLGALGLHKTEFTVDSAVTKIEGAEEN